jgi:cytochrome c-type biogenesis protein CcmH/NrfG
MRPARLMAMLAIFAAMLPEVPRYSRERVILGLQSTIDTLLQLPPADARRELLLVRLASDAETIARANAGDFRVWLMAGSLHLLAGDARRASATYERALHCEERGETMLDLGRAYARLDDRPRAFAAFVRAAWINPWLLLQMPQAAQPLVRQQMDRDEELLREGRLASAPSPPATP